MINAKWHSNEHGWSNFSSFVKVEGPVKITFGTCAWGGNVTVKRFQNEDAAKVYLMSKISSQLDIAHGVLLYTAEKADGAGGTEIILLEE